MPLTSQQIADCAAQIASHLFQGIVSQMLGATVATCPVNWTDIQNAVSAVDTAFDTTLATASTQVATTNTILQYLASRIPAPVSAGTNQQKTILACYVLLKRAGLV